MKKTITKTIKNEKGEDVVVTEEVEVVENEPATPSNPEGTTEVTPKDRIKQALDNKDGEPKTEPATPSVDYTAEIEKLKKEKADLLKEVMSKKEKLKEYDGIDATVAKKLLEEKKAIEEANKVAEKEKLEKEKNWEALKKQMVEENNKVVQGLNDTIASLKAELENNKKERETLFVNNKFEESKYIRENLVLSPAKTKTLYGSYFEVENGELVAYNAPKGSSDRVRLVDASGNNLDFNKAIEKIVSQDPDKDSLLKSKVHAGSGSVGNITGSVNTVIQPKLSAMDKILQGLNNGK